MANDLPILRYMLCSNVKRVHIIHVILFILYKTSPCNYVTCIGSNNCYVCVLSTLYNYGSHLYYLLLAFSTKKVSNYAKENLY